MGGRSMGLVRGCTSGHWEVKDKVFHSNDILDSGKR